MTNLENKYKKFVLTKIKEFLQDDTFLDYFIESFEDEEHILSDKELSILEDLQNTFKIVIK